MTKQFLLSVTGCLLLICAIALGVAWSAPIRLTNEIATPADLTAELRSQLTTVEQALAIPETYSERRDQLKRSAIQLAIFAQALTEHETNSPLKTFAPDIRDSALGLVRIHAYDEAASALARLKDLTEGKATGTAEKKFEWGRLGRASTMMGAMKERSESIRRALRRPKDPEAESRHALAIALIALVIHDDTAAVKNAADKPIWQDACLEVQQHMSRTAAAIKAKDGTAADHFRLGMEACDKCHLKFKP